MKKIFLLILGVLSCQIGVAQFSDQIQDGIGSGFKLVPKESNVLSEVEGTPFLNPEFSEGAVLVEGKEPLPVFIRYNVPQERMEIKLEKEDPKTYFLPLNEDTRYRIGREEYKLNKLQTDGDVVFGYFNVLHPGKQAELLKKYVAEVEPAVKARTGYDEDRPAEIEIHEEYYILFPEGQTKKIELSHRKVRRAFESEEIRNYLEDNRIRDEEDLVAFVKFMDQV